MSEWELFSVLFILFTLSPLVHQRMLDLRRQRAIRQLEQVRESRVIPLIHPQETMRIPGFPVFRYIDFEDSEEVLRAIRLTDPQAPPTSSCTPWEGCCWPRNRSPGPSTSAPER